MPRVFNLLTSYRYVTRNDPSFLAMVRGFFRIIAGRHEEPIEGQEPPNHIGIYDLITLCIPWLIETFIRGNWIRWNWLRSTLRILFQPVIGVLIIVRFTIGSLVTLLALPFLVVSYYLLY